MHMSSIVQPPKRKTAKSDKQFPGKLYDLISFAEHGGHEDIISWVHDGKAFAVHDPDRFVKELLPLFFGQTKYRSFRRQLNMWSFDRVLGSSHKGIFTHPFFVKGQKERCKEMCRRDYQVAGMESMQMAQESIVREVYKNAPMLAHSPGNVANRPQQSTSFLPQGLSPARPPSMSGMLPIPMQGVEAFDNDALSLLAQSSSSFRMPLNMQTGIANSTHELQPSRPQSLSAGMPAQNQPLMVQVGSAPIPLSSLSSMPNVPMMGLQSVQLSFDSMKFDGTGPEKIDSCSQLQLQKIQQEFQQELRDDSSDNKKLPAKPKCDNDLAAGETRGDNDDDDNLPGGIAVPFEGRQFFFVDVSSSSEEEAAAQSFGIPTNVALPLANWTGTVLEFPSSVNPQQPSVMTENNNFPSSMQDETDAQNQLLQQFARWKTHGPPDEDMGEEDFDHLFD